MKREGALALYNLEFVGSDLGMTIRRLEGMYLSRFEQETGQI